MFHTETSVSTTIQWCICICFLKLQISFSSHAYLSISTIYTSPTLWFISFYHRPIWWHTHPSFLRHSLLPYDFLLIWPTIFVHFHFFFYTALQNPLTISATFLNFHVALFRLQIATVTILTLYKIQYLLKSHLALTFYYSHLNTKYKYIKCQTVTYSCLRPTFSGKYSFFMTSLNIFKNSLQLLTPLYLFITFATIATSLQYAQCPKSFPKPQMLLFVI